jgi:hypothetical protein
MTVDHQEGFVACLTKRYTSEQIIGMLREVEVQLAKRVGIAG